MKKPKRHHFLPKCYLEGFTRDGLTWVYDRKEDVTRGQQPVNTAVINHFYSIETDAGKDTGVETMLAGIDGQIPLLVDELRNRVELETSRRLELAYVATFMMNRVPNFHKEIQTTEGEIIKRLTQSIPSREVVEQMIADWKVENPDAGDMNAKEVFEFFRGGEYEIQIHRNRSIQMMLQLSPKFARMLASLNTFVMHAPKGSAFITTDRPFVIHGPQNPNDVSPWGGVGLLTPGTHKYLPLASDLAVVFGDPGSSFFHVDVSASQVKGVNGVIGWMTDRFLIGRDKSLVEWWAKRLKLGSQSKVQTLRVF